MVSNLLNKVQQAGLVKPLLWGSTALIPFGIDICKNHHTVVVPEGTIHRPVKGLTVLLSSEIYYRAEQISFEDRRMENDFCLPCPSSLGTSNFDHITNAHIRALQNACKQLKPIR